MVSSRANHYIGSGPALEGKGHSTIRIAAAPVTRVCSVVAARPDREYGGTIPQAALLHWLPMLHPRSLLPVALAALLLPAVGYSGNEAPTGAELIDRSIAHHDPNGVWNTHRIRLAVSTVYSEEFAASHNRLPTAEVELLLAPGHGEFHYTKRTGGDLIEIGLVDGEGTLSVNGSTDVSDAEKARLNIAGPELYRDYGEYVYLMPMKLRDAGTIVAPQTEVVAFEGRRVLSVTVTYDPTVGEHTWHFYFDPDTYALVGCRFYREDPAKDGEYITFEGEIVDEASGLRLPKTRAWYYNKNGTHLGTDDVTSLTSS